jgi:hypothetical protein
VEVPFIDESATRVNPRSGRNGEFQKIGLASKTLLAKTQFAE